MGREAAVHHQDALFRHDPLELPDEPRPCGSADLRRRIAAPPPPATSPCGRRRPRATARARRGARPDRRPQGPRRDRAAPPPHRPRAPRPPGSSARSPPATMSSWTKGMEAGGRTKRRVEISPILQPTATRQSACSMRSFAMRVQRPKSPTAQGVAAGERALAAQGVSDGNGLGLREGAKLGPGAREVNPAPRQDGGAGVNGEADPRRPASRRAPVGCAAPGSGPSRRAARPGDSRTRRGPRPPAHRGPPARGARRWRRCRRGARAPASGSRLRPG